MKMKKTIILAVAVLLPALTAGCKNSSENLSAQAPENT